MDDDPLMRSPIQESPHEHVPESPPLIASTELLREPKLAFGVSVLIDLGLPAGLCTEYMNQETGGTFRKNSLYMFTNDIGGMSQVSTVLGPQINSLSPEARKHIFWHARTFALKRASRFLWRTDPVITSAIRSYLEKDDTDDGVFETTKCRVLSAVLRSESVHVSSEVIRKAIAGDWNMSRSSLLDYYTDDQKKKIEARIVENIIRMESEVMKVRKFEHPLWHNKEAAPYILAGIRERLSVTVLVDIARRFHVNDVTEDYFRGLFNRYSAYSKPGRARLLGDLLHHCDLTESDLKKHSGYVAFFVADYARLVHNRRMRSETVKLIADAMNRGASVGELFSLSQRLGLGVSHSFITTFFAKKDPVPEE